MKFMKRAAALALSAALCLSMLAGCSSKPAASSFTVPESIDLAAVTDPILATTGMAGDTVVATAGDVEVTADELAYWVAYSADQMLQYYAPYGIDRLPWEEENPEADAPSLAQTMKDTALEKAVFYHLLPAKAQEMGLEMGEDFQTSLDSALSSMTEMLGSEEAFAHYLWQFPTTKEKFTLMCQAEEYIAQYVQHTYGEGGESYPTDADLLSFVEDGQQCYFFKHILFKVDDEDPKSAETQKAKADETLAKLRAADNDIELFDELMNELSEDGRGPDGKLASPDGYLGTASPSAIMGTKMVDVVEQAALNMEEGEISEVVENTQGYHGYHIVLRLPVEGNVPLDDDLRTAYIGQQMSDLQSETVAAAEVKTNENFDAFDPAVFTDSLTVLRAAITAEGEAKAEAQKGDSSADSSAPADAQPDVSQPADSSAAQEKK